MKTVGLITEYNPFHNGHLHHLRESLGVAAAEVSVAVMSGHFLQRGEAALVDKWSRARMALTAGVDLVVELPLPWACGSAPVFADGGVRVLNALGGIDALCFGSESGDLESLRHYADILLVHGREVERETARLLKQGMTYPQARARVLSARLPESSVEGLSTPNNILGIEYLKALCLTESPIRPLTIQRIGAGYHDSVVQQGRIASATGIRRCLRAGEDVTGFLPDEALKLLRQALKRGEGSREARYFSVLLGRIFSQAETLNAYWLVENGIENRLLAEADRAADLEALVTGIKSRQLTRTRIQRMLVSIFLGLKKDEVADLLDSGPRYLHLLAASEKGQAYLAASRQQRTLPLIQNFSRIYATLKRCYGAGSGDYRLAMSQLNLELKATRMYSLLTESSWSYRNGDFYRPLIRTGER